MTKTPFNFDEREVRTFQKITTLMYLLTILALMVIQFYRQFVLQQPQEAWNDIAMLLTVNILVLIAAVLYLTGTVNPQKIKLRYLLAGYLGFVLIGFLFTIFKYRVLLAQPVGLAQVWDYLSTVVIISGLIVLALAISAYLGSRRIEEQIS